MQEDLNMLAVNYFKHEVITETCDSLVKKSLFTTNWKMQRLSKSNK